MFILAKEISNGLAEETAAESLDSQSDFDLLKLMLELNSSALSVLI